MMRKGIIIITAFLVLLLCACSEKPTILYDMDWYSAEALDEVISFMVPEGYEDTGVWTETEDGKLLEAVTEHGPYVVYFNIWNPERDLTPNEDQCFENMLYGVRFKD